MLMAWLRITSLFGLVCFMIKPVCSCNTTVSLVNGPYGVDNSSMTSSGDWSLPGTSICYAHLGRLHMQPYFAPDGIEYSAWCAQSTSNQTDYLQVEFASLKTVVAVSTQGRVQSPASPSYSFYTKSYLVRYSNDGITWSDVMENYTSKIFPGNDDRETVVTNTLPFPVEAKYIRVTPQSWSSAVCLRLDILGCDVAVPSCTTNHLLVNGPYGVDNSSMTSSTHWSVPGTSIYPAYVARLHMQPYLDIYGTEYNSWAPPVGSYKMEYLQVEFASLKTVVAVLTQGRTQSPIYQHLLYYTKSYIVQYSYDGVVWNDVMENNVTKIFPANFDRDTVVTNYLPTPVRMKYIRLIPQTWQDSPCLRIDVLGCDAYAIESEPLNITKNGTGTLWGYAGAAIEGIPTTNITLNTTTSSRVRCVSFCTSIKSCLIVSFEKATNHCVGYEMTHLIGPFTPSDPSNTSLNDFPALYFNYDYAEILGFTSILLSGVSYKIPRSRKTKQVAEVECQSLKAILVAFSLTAQVTELKHVISNSPTHMNEPGLFVSGFLDNGSYIDSKGNPVPDKFWGLGQPDVSFQCIVLTPDGELKTHNCSDTLYFICSLL